MDDIENLIDILFDKNARTDEKDDAAMDLAQFNDDRALNALIKAAHKSNEDETVLETIGESIASIWLGRNKFFKEVYDSLPKRVKSSINIIIKFNKPEWINFLH